MRLSLFRYLRLNISFKDLDGDLDVDFEHCCDVMFLKTYRVTRPVSGSAPAYARTNVFALNKESCQHFSACVLKGLCEVRALSMPNHSWLSYLRCHVVV